MNLSGELLSEAEVAELRFASDAAVPTGSLSLSIGDKSYNVQTGDEGSCSQLEPDDLWYEYYHAGGTHTDLTLYVASLEEAAGGTTRFGFGIDLAPIHEVGNSGTVTATRAGDQVTLVMDTRTAEGTPVHATITCTLP